MLFVFAANLTQTWPESALYSTHSFVGVYPFIIDGNWSGEHVLLVRNEINNNTLTYQSIRYDEDC
mgnify:FL=1